MKPKTTRKRKPTIVRRTAASNLDHMAIVSDYIEGTLSVSEIAAHHQTTEKNVGLIANRTWKEFTNMRESRLLAQVPQDAEAHYDVRHALASLQGTDEINQEFLDLLSDNGSHLLSDAEATYCWVMVHTGDTQEAIKTSGLDKGLFRAKPDADGTLRDKRFNYDRALNLRSLYLNSKPNVVAYIKELRETRLIDADVGKARIQTELIDQITQMKASGQANKNRMAMLRSIELLGKTVGAFVERVEITEIDPNRALDELIEMAKAVEVIE